jgi:hypothetical protein
VINVSWFDAESYASWLSQKTGKTYRLLSESEWEYAARAGTTTNFATGATISKNQAQFDAKQTVEVGSFPANRWGLHDMHGNVFQWVEDCYELFYTDAPTNGLSAMGPPCDTRVLRGGSWLSLAADYLRSTYRMSFRADYRDSRIGFRVARTLTPTPGSKASPTTAWTNEIAEAKQRILAGDIVGARQILDRPAAADNAEALLLLAETYDPYLLAAWGVRGVTADITISRSLYGRAQGHGLDVARSRLKALD